MIYLLIVSMVWAVSFGLIKGNLSGLDSHFVAFARLVLSFLFFSVFIKVRSISLQKLFSLLALGAVQFGLMYIFYIYSYRYLDAWQIALFTIITPFYVSLINDLFNKVFNPVYMFAAFLSIAGAAVIVYKDIGTHNIYMGFFMMQISNFCFALGQVWYKKIKKAINVSDIHIFPWMFLGAMLISGINSLINTDYAALTVTSIQLYTIIYLGILASGICFFLWNYGATKVNTGSLAVLNNLKVPLGIAASIFIFGESADYIKMSIGTTIILGALFISERAPTTDLKKMVKK